MVRNIGELQCGCAFEKMERAQSDSVSALDRMEKDRILDMSEWTRLLEWQAHLFDKLGRVQDASDSRERAAAVAALIAEVPPADELVP